jgi:signal transduction histidine kinase
LSIAQWIAQVHGAEITLASTPGTGTTVEVRFPRYVRPVVSSP